MAGSDALPRQNYSPVRGFPNISPDVITLAFNQLIVDINAALAAVSGGGSGIEITDGTNDVTGATKLTVTGGTVGGATPNATLTITGGGGGPITSSVVPISSAQLLTIHSSPTQIIPAPGPNKMIIILEAIGYYLFGTVDYVGNRTPSLYYGVGGVLAIGDFFNWALGRSQIQVVKQLDDNENPSIFLNKPIILTDSADYTTGDGTAKISVIYTIVDFS